MNQNTNNFDRRLKNILFTSGVGRGELAHYLGVSVPTVNRWLNGISTPNVYQFREIAHFFGLPYGWFLDNEGIFFDIEELSTKLGLSTETLYGLLHLADDPDGNKAVLSAMDALVQAALAVEDAVWEDLDRYTDKVIAEAARDLK